MRKLSVLNPLPDNLNITDYEVIFGQGENRLSIFMSHNLPKKADLKFRGYSDKPNKSKIRKLADGCCGYCGIRINNTSTETVEHFRPKAELHFKKNYLEVDGLNSLQRTGKHTVLKDKCEYGYFLWGDDGYNLLPACECCNTGQGKNGICISSSVPPDKGAIEYNLPYGKKNFFPILLNKKGTSEDLRVNKQYVRSICNEYPLLFNPYTDDPNYLFQYKDPIPSSSGNQQLIKIRPNRGLSKKDHLKAQVSINMFGLNRSHLCVERAKAYLSLYAIAVDILDLIRNNTNDTDYWGYNISRLISYFDKEHAYLLGFCNVKFGCLVDRVHSEILTRFPTQNFLTVTDIFERKIRELTEFSKQHKTTASINTNIQTLFNQI